MDFKLLTMCLMSLTMLACGGQGSGSEPKEESVRGNVNANTDAAGNEGGTSSKLVLKLISSASQNSAEEGSKVTLQAVNLNDPTDKTLTYRWAQVSGPLIRFNDSKSASVSIRLPYITEATAVEIEVAASNTDKELVTASITINVEPVFHLTPLFPMPESVYNGDRIDITGTLQAPRGDLEQAIVEVSSAGRIVQADLDSNSGRWRANSIEIDHSKNKSVIDVTATLDDFIDQYQIELDHGPLIDDNRHFHYYPVTEKFLSYNNVSKELLAISRSGDVEYLEITNNRSFPFSYLTKLYVDKENDDNNKLFMLSNDYLYHYNLNSGVLGSFYLGNSNRASNFSVHENGDRFFIYYDGDLDQEIRIVEYNWQKNTTSIIASSEVGSGAAIDDIVAMEYSENDNAIWALTTQSLGQPIVSIDLSHKTRSAKTLKYFDEVSLGVQPIAIFDEDQRSFYYMNASCKGICQVNIDNANVDRKYVTGDFTGYLSISSEQKTTMFSISSEGIVSYLPTGEQEMLIDFSVGSSGNIRDFQDIKYSKATNSIVLTSPYSLDTGFSTVDLNTGVGHVGLMYENSAPKDRDIPPSFKLHDMFLYENGKFALFYSFGAIYKIDLSNGDVTLVSDQSKGNWPSSPTIEQIIVDEKNGRAYARSWGKSNIFYEVDLETGNRKRYQLADSLNLHSLYFNPLTESFYALTKFDPYTNMEFLTLSSDLSTESRSVYQGGILGINSLVPEFNEQELYFVKYDAGYSIVQSDLEFQNERTLSSKDVGQGYIYADVSGFDVDTENQRAFVVYDQKVYLVDLLTGNRAVIFR